MPLGIGIVDVWVSATVAIVGGRNGGWWWLKDKRERPANASIAI